MALSIQIFRQVTPHSASGISMTNFFVTYALQDKKRISAAHESLSVAKKGVGPARACARHPKFDPTFSHICVSDAVLSLQFQGLYRTWRVKQAPLPAGSSSSQTAHLSKTGDAWRFRFWV
jgi:hypothetical protein